jgi:dephospho-CoA kinase
VPLLVESGRYRVSGVIVVDAPPEVAVERLVRDRGMTAEEARARMARQATREERLAKADFVIDNAGPPEALAAAVDRAWAWIATLPDEPA